MIFGSLFLRRSALTSALLFFLSQASFSQVRIPRLISDGMVLQRGAPIHIWGWSGAGEKVTVRLGSSTASGDADKLGNWSVMLDPVKPGGPYNIEIDGINHIEVRNVLVGDVWVCSGQSNMELLMERVKEKYPDIIAHSDNNSIRQYKVPQRYDFSGPVENLNGGRWEPATPTSVLDFSAVAYFFARSLYEKYHIPIGLINASVGGSPAEAWLSPTGLRNFPEQEAVAARYADKTFRDNLPAGEAEKIKFQPGGLYNGMIGPVTGASIKGVIWYQGEANTGRAGEYHYLFSSLISDWRFHFRQGDLPFIYVQLPNYMEPKELPSDSKWAELREAQRETLSLPNTGMAVAIDLGEAKDIHPLNKQDVGERLALVAEHLAYGRNNFVWTGPMYHSMKAHGGKMYIRFDEINEGLVVKGGGELRGFVIAGEDGKFVPAKAVIDGKEVVVWNETVPHPMRVRYAWADNPAEANLSNRGFYATETLPASPFEGAVRVRRK